MGFLFSCKHDLKEAPMVLRTGINGEAYYILNDDGSVGSVLKKECQWNGAFVMIKSDSIKLGEEFVGVISIGNPDFEIVIQKPTNSKILSTPNADAPASYSFEPDSIGTYEFVGTARYDTIQRSFKYKFIVTPR